MEINQDTLNFLFKELCAMAFLQQKSQNELNELYQYYTMQEARLINQFYHYQTINEQELKLVNRFMARISEAFQLMMAKRQIIRCKESKFQPSIYNCLTQTFEGKNSLICQLIQAIYGECRLQIEVLTNKNQKIEVKRIHSQDNNNDEEKLQNQFYSVQVTNKKNIQNDWQVNMKNNKKLNNYYLKVFPKLYDVISSVDKSQDEQILYFQNRDQNMDRIFNQLLQQNQHIKQSLNWSVNLDQEVYNNKIEQKLQKIKLQQLIPSHQLSTQSSPTKPSQPSNKSIKQNAPTSPFKNNGINNSHNPGKMPSINVKFRSISQNVPMSETNFKSQNNFLNPQQFQAQQNQQQQQYYSSEIEKSALFSKIIENYKQNQFQLNKIKIEFKPKRQHCSVLKSKLMIDLIPLHNSKLKPKATRHLLQQVPSIIN
ncbi:unnamed protein product (macronuclear) [Paramecium tetraurelia]|uniref:Uncharacterized protein n=1 Tax=Paramecium tetraurelia TaxID=5888 RepID=A0DQJ5_PARTE|nr:uncharacterized protein GSPATT00002712001 [Paramecium tetraurelia]CAK85312.1 unnamed protein product [Paramecium tetraurelia]|eukprot:XP_001452709.1 hypothetical protein (macronuclear) [Paramecium tetraurelia strain d4-2]